MKNSRIIISFFLVIFFLVAPVNSHITHYKDLKKIEMEIFKDDKLIGYNYYFFTKENGFIIVKNQLNFKVSLFGIDVLKIEGYGEEKYKNNKLISYESKTLQNDKKKFVNLVYLAETNEFNIKGSSYSGLANVNNIVGNWWNHQILQANSQISPISGSIKEQVVTFLAKEKIVIYGKTIDVDHFKLTSKDMSIPKEKRLDFDIWYDNKNSMIVKVTYSRMGNWEYRLKNFE
jgi:hypothetical protein